MRLILASASKGRKDVFEMLGLKHEIIVSDDEEKSDKADFSEFVMELSKIKADCVAKKLGGERALIVSADTQICLESRRFGKPKNKEEAFENIKLFSGKVPYALTGVTIKDLYQDKELSFFDKTDVYFKEVTEKDMRWYVENDPYILERAGFSMGGGKAAIFVDKIVGDYYNVIGMPIGKLYTKFNELGYEISDFEIK